MKCTLIFPRTHHKATSFSSLLCVNLALVFEPDLWNSGGGRMFASCSTPLPRPELTTKTKHYIVKALRVLVRRFKWRYFILHWIQQTAKTFMHRPPPPPHLGMNMGPGSQTGNDIIQRLPPPQWTEWQTFVKTLFCPQTSFAGGKYARYSCLFVGTELLTLKSVTACRLQPLGRVYFVLNQEPAIEQKCITALCRTASNSVCI